MSSFKNTVALVGAFATSALAHGLVANYTMDGVDVPGWNLNYYYQKVNGQTPPVIPAWSSENLDNGFIDGTGYKTSDINCHKKAAPGGSYGKVAAGGEVVFKWTAWPESHVGPVLTYAAKCEGECTEADPATLKWVKIDNAGYDESGKGWAAAELIKNNNEWPVTIPSNLAAGKYVLRHEIIAMHGAGSENGAQNYPFCVNVEITGSGTENPEGVLGTELYTPTDAGILFNPYTTITNYVPPGPALFGPGSGFGKQEAGAGSGSGSAPAPAPSTPTTPGNTTSPAVPSAAPTAAADEDEGCASKAARRHARDLYKHRRH
ncbi:glycosyl hydrolase family 61 [Colletotrichum sojae]|uniref:lytic cellulose monooxygenase (C4-dehydrogenating) n=1 Tax=Colletotrichum sojae TaxID=2175907 RepID=A0A8H6JD49_9PEZI|nr:glycosyl hydrolase family 61 [Colletotrichum sojae]